MLQNLAGVSKGLQMKVNEIISEAGVWQGVKTIGKGLGQVAGGAAMGSMRFLDRLAGGTGNIGTAAQQAAYTSQERTVAQTSARAQLPKDALAKFKLAMQEKGFDISKPATFNSNELKQELQTFAFQYYAGREEQPIQQYILRGIQAEPLPPVINPSSVLQYLTDINTVRNKAFQVQKQSQPVSIPSPAPTPPDSTENAGVIVQPGRRIVVTDPRTSGSYYKTDKGWFNGVGQPVTRPESISYLENLAERQGREEPIPSPMPTPAPRAPKARRRRQK